ncbi:MAG TPA: tyrosine-type recombinase/integrase [Burkholderiaceae bacterium]
MFDRYEGYLRSRAQPAKKNSFDSLRQARRKLKDWDDRKVRLISAAEILDRFDLHAVAKGHRTSAEAMGRWVTTAVDKAIEREIHDAHSAGRAPSLTYNPFTILRTEERYRSNTQLEREYKAKGVRNPLSFSDTVGKYVEAAWRYRRQNPLAADFILLTMLWSNRRGESATFKWRDQVPDAQAPTERWIDDRLGVGHVGDAKNRGDHEFPIGPFAMQLLKLRRAEQTEGQVWVFPGRNPKSEGGNYKDPTVAMATVKEMAGVKQARGHDLRRTFGAACEKLGFSDRQTKRMLGHATGSGQSVNRYTDPEWTDIADRMRRVEELILSKAPNVYNALRPAGTPALPEPDFEMAPVPERPTRRAPE